MSLSEQYDFIILANSRWDAGGGGNSAQQYARTLAKTGFTYFFAGPTEASKVSGIITSPQVLFGKTIVLCSLPRRDYLDICRLLKRNGCKIIYRIVDYWEYMPRNSWYDKSIENKMIKLADLCYVSSRKLLDRLKNPRGDFKLLPNAVDKEQFGKKPQAKPPDLREGDITIGFWGTFWMHTFDWRLIKSVAQKRSRWAFNLIGGNPAKIKRAAGDIPDNVYLLGEKAWHQLYEYGYYLDLCIIPYLLKPGSDEANPIKALEYLACHKPTVSYYNESLGDIPYLYFYKDGDDFMKKIEIASGIRINRNLVDAFLNKNTWEYRLDTIMNDLRQL